MRPPLAVQPGRGGLPRGLPLDGLVPVTSKPVWEYESPKEIRYCSEQLSTGAVLVLDAELLVLVLVELTLVDEVLVLVELTLVDVLLVLVELTLVELELVEVLLGTGALLVPGMHWSAMFVSDLCLLDLPGPSKFKGQVPGVGVTDSTSRYSACRTSQRRRSWTPCSRYRRTGRRGQHRQPARPPRRAAPGSTW